MMAKALINNLNAFQPDRNSKLIKTRPSGNLKMLVKEKLDWKCNSWSFYRHQWGTDTFIQKPLDYVQVKLTQTG